jgi:hypothetical protein
MMSPPLGLGGRTGETLGLLASVYLGFTYHTWGSHPALYDAAAYAA